MITTDSKVTAIKVGLSNRMILQRKMVGTAGFEWIGLIFPSNKNNDLQNKKKLALASSSLSKPQSDSKVTALKGSAQ